MSKAREKINEIEEKLLRYLRLNEYLKSEILKHDSFLNIPNEYNIKTKPKKVKIEAESPKTDKVNTKFKRK